MIALVAIDRFALVRGCSGAFAEQGGVVVSMLKAIRIPDFNPVDRMVRHGAGHATAEPRTFGPCGILNPNKVFRLKESSLAFTL